MKTLQSLALTLALLVPAGQIGTAQAAERGIKAMLEECFMGLAFEDEDSRSVSILLNLITGSLGTFPIASGLLSEDSFCANKTIASLGFITESYASLLEETVKGNGEHLSVALKMAGCEAGAHPAAIADLRRQIPAILQSAPTDRASIEGVSSYYQGLQLAAARNCTV